MRIQLVIEVSLHETVCPLRSRVAGPTPQSGLFGIYASQLQTKSAVRTVLEVMLPLHSTADDEATAKATMSPQ